MPSDDLTRAFHVLVVDDEADARELLVDYFHSLGFNVTGAGDGRSAITTLQHSKGIFGLVVTDLNLPGADGFAVLQAARQANASSHVVIVTGYASLDSAIRAVRVGAYDYLTKPFSLTQLDVILARIRDRMARSLGQRPAKAPPRSTTAIARAPAPAASSSIERRVTAIERSMGRIEALLEALAGHDEHPTMSCR